MTVDEVYNPADMLAVGERDVRFVGDVYDRGSSVSPDAVQSNQPHLRCYVHDTAAFLLLTFCDCLGGSAGLFSRGGKAAGAKISTVTMANW